MSEQWRYATPPAPDYAPLMRPADDENIFDDMFQRGADRPTNRMAGLPVSLFLAALGGVGLIVLAFI